MLICQILQEGNFFFESLGNLEFSSLWVSGFEGAVSPVTLAIAMVLIIPAMKMCQF